MCVSNELLDLIAEEDRLYGRDPREDFGAARALTSSDIAIAAPALGEAWTWARDNAPPPLSYERWPL